MCQRKQDKSFRIKKNMENVKLFIESNIWCYYFDESSKEHKAVASYLDDILSKKDVVMNSIVIMELSHYLIKNLGPIKGKEKIERLLEFPFQIEDFDYELMRSSVEALSEYSHTGVGGRDATIIATMKKLGIKNLLTHDKTFKKIDFIDVIDPIKQ